MVHRSLLRVLRVVFVIALLFVLLSPLAAY
jgi:hypothetical protein